MGMPINTGSFSKALWPGINAWYGEGYDEFPVEHTDLFEQFTSRKAFEEDVGITSFGLMQVKPESQGTNYDQERQAYITRYTHITYSLGFMITKEMVDDDLYDVVGKRRAKGLAFSSRQTKETLGSNVYNRAFNTSYTGGDGLCLLNTAHTNAVGGTWSNRPSSASTLNEAALEQAVIDIAKWKNDRGLRINVMPKSIHIPPDLMFDLERVMKSRYRVTTGDNDINALVEMGKFPAGIKVNHYFSSTTAWFIRTNVPDGMKHFVRDADRFAEDNDFDTNNAKFKTEFRDSWGWTDPRALYGDAGV